MDDILFPSFKPRLRASAGVRTGVSNLASHGRGRRSDKQTRLTERVRVELRANRSALPWETEAVLASGAGAGAGAGAGRKGGSPTAGSTPRARPLHEDCLTIGPAHVPESDQAGTTARARLARRPHAHPKSTNPRRAAQTRAGQRGIRAHGHIFQGRGGGMTAGTGDRAAAAGGVTTIT